MMPMQVDAETGRIIEKTRTQNGLFYYKYAVRGVLDKWIGIQNTDGRYLRMIFSRFGDCLDWLLGRNTAENVIKLFSEKADKAMDEVTESDTKYVMNAVEFADEAAKQLICDRARALKYACDSGRNDFTDEDFTALWYTMTPCINIVELGFSDWRYE